MSEPATICIVDDDEAIRLVFGRTLTEAGYKVVECKDGAEALELVARQEPSLILLDVDMPRVDGWNTLAGLRQRGCKRPILMITHIDDVPARVHGLESGADDYLGKPCSPAELLARVRALLRRFPPPASPKLRWRDVEIDLTSSTATKAGQPLRLTRTDYALLRLMHEQRGRPVPRETILKEIWDGKSDASHALDTHLWRLRKKLGDTDELHQWIRNVAGVGYLMAEE